MKVMRKACVPYPLSSFWGQCIPLVPLQTLGVLALDNLFLEVPTRRCPSKADGMDISKKIRINNDTINKIEEISNIIFFIAQILESR